MRQYRVRGKTRIAGDIEIGGAKNAVLPILAAVCLNERETIIHNCPRIADTFVSIDILSCMGYKPKFEKNTLIVNASSGVECDIPDECVSKMRSSILFMGAMLAKCGHVKIANPGGCDLGTRAIDLHINGLREMGAKIHYKDGKLHCHAEGLKGAKIHLHTASVGATENLMIAAVKAKGETIIENAAKEPEIIDLACFLTGMGAKIKGAGTSKVVIEGVEQLSQKRPHFIMPDRIVAGTYLVAAAITGGEIKLDSINPTDLLPTINPLKEMGCHISVSGASVHLKAPQRLKAMSQLTTKVHPGFPTDMQAQLVAALALAKGDSSLTETIFDGRNQHAHELSRMGAKIVMSNNNATFNITGVDKLHGKVVQSKDLRGGAALVLAGLAAEGETIVQNAEYIERGYEHIDKDLNSLGADIVFEEVIDAEKCA